MQNLLASATETGPRTGREIKQQWLIALAIFVAALWLYTRHNDFPFYYHPDEPSKVAQIRDGTRNFNHPLLLLTATDLTRWLSGGTADCQHIVELGRWGSAVFGAAAVALLSWLGFNRFGVPGGIVTGVVMLVQRRIYENAHFMKEDAALLAGVALTFVAIDLFCRTPRARHALFLGAAVAVAASSKYVGLVMVPIALAVVFASRAFRKQSLACLAAFVAVVAVINYEAVLSPAGLISGFTGEIERLNTRAGAQWNFAPFYWVRTFLELSPFLLLLFVAQLIFAVRNFRALPLPDLLLSAFPFAFGLLLSFSSKQSGGRHMLPAMMIAVLLGCFAALRLASELQRRRVPVARAIVAVLLALILAYDTVRTSVLDRGFARDHRRELVDWITAHVPHNSTIGVEDRVGIPYDKPRRFCEMSTPLPQQVRGARFAADLGTLDDLRGSGVTHIAVTEAHYYIFFDEKRVARNPDEAFARRRNFYQRLFAEGRLVWSRETGNVGVLNPSLRLYEIAPPASARTP